MMRNTALAFVSLLLTAFCNAGPTMDGHGLGFLQRVRNNSEYAITFQQSKTILDYLPDGTIIRIKSIRKEYGVQGRYYAARKIVGAYRLAADTLDPDDPATHFVVKRFVARDFSEYIGIYSDVAQGQYMQSDDSRAVTFSLPDMMDDKTIQGHWNIIDANGGGSGAISDKKFLDPNFAANVFNTCYLKCRASGVVQSRGTPQNYPGTTKAPQNKYVNPILAGTESSTSTNAPADTPQETSSDQSASANPGAPISSASNAPSTGTTSSNNAATSAAPKSSQTALGSLATISQTKCSMVTASTDIAALTTNGVATRQKSDGSWESLTQGLNGTSLASLALGSDGTLIGSDSNNTIWIYDGNQKSWNKLPMLPLTGSISKIILSDAEHGWVLTQNGGIFQKTTNNSKTAWQPPASTPGSGGIRDICTCPDGTIFVITNDNKIYQGTASGSQYSFTLFASPQDILSTVPYTITASSPSSVAFTTPANEVYMLVSGKSGSTADSWKKLTKQDGKTPIKLRSIAASSSTSLAGVVANSGSADDNTVVLISNITTS